MGGYKLPDNAKGEYFENRKPGQTGYDKFQEMSQDYIDHVEDRPSQTPTKAALDKKKQLTAGVNQAIHTRQNKNVTVQQPKEAWLQAQQLLQKTKGGQGGNSQQSILNPRPTPTSTFSLLTED